MILIEIDGILIFTAANARVQPEFPGTVGVV